MSFKIDLHTHSYGSSDGGLGLKHYKYFLDNKLLNYIAITDHGSIQVAQDIQRKLGERIIVGQEVMTKQGEIIGLYLTNSINDGQDVTKVIDAIKKQGGLVYVPHPFETVRSGISEKTLGEIIKDVDIIEVHNGRAVFQNRGRSAAQWAENSAKAMAASSDAHGRYGWGMSYSIIEQAPSQNDLVQLLGTAQYMTGKVGAGIIYPKLNRLRKMSTKHFKRAGTIE